MNIRKNSACHGFKDSLISQPYSCSIIGSLLSFHNSSDDGSTDHRSTLLHRDADSTPALCPGDKHSHRSHGIDSYIWRSDRRSGRSLNPWQALFFLIFIFVLQQLEGDLIYPRVVGSTTGVPSVYVFASVTIGGTLFGLAGMLFAVPVFSIVFTLLKEVYERRQKAGTE